MSKNSRLHVSLMTVKQLRSEIRSARNFWRKIALLNKHSGSDEYSRYLVMFRPTDRELAAALEPLLWKHLGRAYEVGFGAGMRWAKDRKMIRRVSSRLP